MPLTTTASALQQKMTLTTLQRLRSAGEKITCLALYDAAMAAIAQASGVEMLLVGDSLGMTVQGHDSTLPVTMEHMCYHTHAVNRGNQLSLIIADMPFMSYSTPEQAALNAGALMQAGAHMVKLEGGSWLQETVSKLSQMGIPVCAHLGLTPQSVNKLGGYRVQGREQAQADQIRQDAKVLAEAGADCLVLECVPSALSQTITKEIDIITIGIGAGKDTDGQVLVVNDLLGMTPNSPKFSKNFLHDSDSIQDAICRYVSDVKSSQFPTEQHCF